MKFSAFLFIIPLLFIYTPIMMPEGLTVQAVQAMVTSFIAVAAAAAALSSFLLCRTTLAERAGLAAGATLLLFPQWSLNLAGAALLVDRKEHTSELQSLMRISYAVFCLKKKKKDQKQHNTQQSITLA